MMRAPKAAPLFEKKAPPVEIPAEWAPGVPIGDKEFQPAIDALVELAQIDATAKGFEMWQKKAVEAGSERASEIRKEHSSTWERIYKAHCAAVLERNPAAEIPKSVSLPGKRLQTITTDATLTASPLDAAGIEFWIEKDPAALRIQIDMTALNDSLEAEDFKTILDFVKFLGGFPAAVSVAPSLPATCFVSRKGDIVDVNGEIQHWGGHADWFGEETPPELPGISTTPETIRLTPYSYPASK